MNENIAGKAPCGCVHHAEDGIPCEHDIAPAKRFNEHTGLIGSHEISKTGKSVYIVAVYKAVKPGDTSKLVERQRTWGWYSKFEDAEKAVLENHTDIFEINYYDHAIIEKMPEGVGAIAEQERWFYRADYSELHEWQEKNPPVGTPEYEQSMYAQMHPKVERITEPEMFGSFFNLTL